MEPAPIDDGTARGAVTRVLEAVRRGEPRAADQLLPLVYDELRRLAATRLAREAPGQTLQPTALVHEAYPRLIGPDPARAWDGSAHRWQRYPTALALGQDVQRYLDDEPVEASPPSILYRAAKLARKHRAAVLTVAGAVLMLAGTALVSSWLMLRAQQDARPAWATPSQPRWILKDYKDVAWCVAFTPDGKSLVSCAGNRDAAAGELRGYLLVHGEWRAPEYKRRIFTTESTEFTEIIPRLDI